MNLNSNYSQALTEVLYLVKNMDEVDKNKISSKFINFLEKNCDKNYKVGEIYLNKPDTLLTETKIVLSLIYREYFCDEKTRKQKENEDIEYFNTKYNVKKIFENNIPTQTPITHNIKNGSSQEKGLIKTSRFQKIINKIKNFLNIRKDNRDMSNMDNNKENEYILQKDYDNKKQYSKMDKLAEYRERMEWAKEHKDRENFFKYYELYKKEYERLSGKNFDEEFGK